MMFYNPNTHVMMVVEVKIATPVVFAIMILR